MHPASAVSVYIKVQKAYSPSITNQDAGCLSGSTCIDFLCSGSRGWVQATSHFRDASINNHLETDYALSVLIFSSGQVSINNLQALHVCNTLQLLDPVPVLFQFPRY